MLKKEREREREREREKERKNERMKNNRHLFLPSSMLYHAPCHSINKEKEEEGEECYWMMSKNNKTKSNSIIWYIHIFSNKCTSHHAYLVRVVRVKSR